MSGYGGQPPPGAGWPDPYGQQPPQGAGGYYGQHDYGYGYGYGYDYGYQYGPQYGPQYDPMYGPPGVRQDEAGLVSPIISMVLNSTLVMACNPIAIGGIIASSMALHRSSRDPESSRRLAVWSWVFFVVSLVLWIGLFVLLGLIDASDEPDTGGSDI